MRTGGNEEEKGGGSTIAHYTLDTHDIHRAYDTEIHNTQSQKTAASSGKQLQFKSSKQLHASEKQQEDTAALSSE